MNRQLLNGFVVFRFRGCRFRDLSRREVYLVDSVCRAYAYTLAAKFALAEIDVGQVVFQGDSLEWTFFDAFSTTDASDCTSLAGDIPLVLVHAAHENTAVFRTFVPQFDDVSRAGFHAGTAGNTFLVGNDGQTVGIHVYGIECANVDAIAATKTSVGTIRFTPVEGMLDRT